jgi:hypothetical protein
MKGSEQPRRRIGAGEKVNCDAVTQDQGKVRLGDNAPAFVRSPETR